ncbi:MAG: hypothetical protein ACLVGF_11525 [Eubacterium sp.]|uniref:hypothetical protein n=1 Tax=Eubacterium sp. TaxID=142586 RepID=UPI00399A8788
MVGKVFVSMFAISIFVCLPAVRKSKQIIKNPVTENAVTKEKSNDSNKKPVNLVWMTDSTWTDYLVKVEKSD